MRMPAQRSPLTAHPSTPCDAIRAFEVRVQVREPDLLRIEYALQGDLARLRIPPPRTAQRVDELWKHTCFEAFLVTDDSPGYYELNFSPSGEWAAYRFSAYRTGMTPADGVGVPTTRVAREATALQVEAAIARRRPSAKPVQTATAVAHRARRRHRGQRAAECRTGRSATRRANRIFTIPMAFALEISP